MASNKADRVYAEAQNSRFDPNFVQIAEVMDNRDPQRGGRLKVWIQNSQSDRDSKGSWITANYLSPFAGKTKGQPGADSYGQFPKGYGFWAVPPDVGANVAVFFANGKMESCYWFACAYDDRMNTMVPGSATQTMSSSTGYDLPVPITDYDRNSITTQLDQKYINVPLTEGLKKQNLLYDIEKGVPNRSSTRQVTSTVYGLASPRGSSFIIDDGYDDNELNAKTWDDDPDGYQNTQQNNPVNDTRVGSRKNEGIVLRTRSGAQLLLSESNGNVFCINRDGTSRFEMTADGEFIIHAAKSMSIRADEDINFIAGRNMNIDVGTDFNVNVGGSAKVNIVGALDAAVQGQVVVNTGADIRLVAASSIRAQAGSSIDLTSSGKTAITAGASVNLIGSSGVFLSGGGTHFTVNNGTSSSAQIKAANFVTPSVSLNGHIHYHASWSNAENHSDAMKPPTGGGESGSTTAPSTAEPANDVAVQVAESQEVELVQHINSTEEVRQTLEQDLILDTNPDINSDVQLTYPQNYEGLQMLMPVTGQIREFGYWGKNVPTETGGTTNRNGWIIQARGDVVAPDSGLVTVLPNGGLIITHPTGYKSIFYDVETSLFSKDEVTKGQTIGTANNKFTYEIRLNTANIFGFSGTVDPGLFFTTVTGTGADAANKSLMAGKPTNPQAKPIRQTGYSRDSTDMVVITKRRSVGSVMPQRGSKRQPRRTQSTRKGSSTKLPDYVAADVGPIDKTLVGWKVVPTDNLLLTDTREFEGNIAYQTAKGSFRNGKFWMFQDPVKGVDIGYGHLVQPGENFRNGITPEEADQLLVKDLTNATRAAQRLYKQYNMNTPYMAQIVLVEMAYQMGIGKVMEFKRMLHYMAQGEYKKAAAEMRDSLWYRQTRRRTEIMASRMAACE